MNIVSMAMQYLTPMIVDKIASSLGISSPLVTKAIGAMLPTILGGIMGTASKPEGAGKLVEALGKVDTGLLGKLGEMIGGTGQSAMAQGGTDLLGSLLGGSAVGTLAGAAAKFAGIGDGPAKTLLGMVAPVALGSLASQVKTDKLDAGGLAKMLMGQKDNIAAAMPKGFADMLGGAGGPFGALVSAAMPAMAAAPGGMAAPATPAQPRPSATVHEMAPHRPAASQSSWLPWAAAAAALLLGAWYFLGGAPKQSAGLPAIPKGITVEGQDVGAQLGAAVDKLRVTLSNVKDKASAEAAAPQLTQMVQQLDGLGGLRDKLPTQGKQSLAAYATTLLPLLRSWIDAALAGSGVGPILKPITDRLLARVEAMGKA